jgi:hypothetical protein
MPINSRTRLGVAGTVTHLADLLDCVAVILPTRTTSALRRWRRLSATLRD